MEMKQSFARILPHRWACFCAPAIVVLSLCPGLAHSKEIKTNAIHAANAPEWVTPGRVDRIVERIQELLEWNIRRIEVVWYTSEDEFQKFHKLGPTVLAVARASTNSVHVGPRVTTANFDATFGHEMVHVISSQKYKGAIPAWLEEGLANHLAKAGRVDYGYLAKHEAPADVHDLTHPFKGSTEGVRYHYMASQALAEMLAKKCELPNLLRLSVGRSVDQYLATYCQIPNITVAFKQWVEQKAKISGN